MKFHLLNGLTSDYNDAKRSIVANSSNWERSLEILRDAAMDPTIIGTTSKKGRRKNKSYFTRTNKKKVPVCRDFQKGRCNRSNCNFEHVEQPNNSNKSDRQCTHCGKKGHTIEYCYKKKNEERKHDGKGKGNDKQGSGKPTHHSFHAEQYFD